MIALGIIIAVLLLVMLIPVGVDAQYVSNEFKLSAKVCGIHIQLVPKKLSEKHKPKEKKEKKPKKVKAKDDDAAKPKKKLSFNFDELLALAKAALKAVGNFGRKLKVDRFLLHYTAAGSDPYNIAQNFGYVNAALSSLAPICAKRYKVRDCDVWTKVDFMAEKMSTDAALALSIRIGQVLSVAFALLFKAAHILIKNKLRLRKEKKLLQKNQQFNKETNPETQNSNTEEGMK